MKKQIALLLVFSVLIFTCQGISSIAMADTFSVYIAGDSTAQTYPENRAPLTGWGQTIGGFLPKNITVKNHALSGTSSKSFADSGYLDAILREIRAGDYLLIQFGHNDEKSTDSSRYTKPETTYKTYLKAYIDGARENGATPILVTSIERRRFAGGKAIATTLTPYVKAMRELAQEENVTLIDLHEQTLRYYNYLGEEGTKDVFLIVSAGEYPNNKDYANGYTDNTHLKVYGAEQISKILVSELAKTSLPLAEYCKGVESPVPPEAQNPAAEQEKTPPAPEQAPVEEEAEPDNAAGIDAGIAAMRELADMGLIPSGADGFNTEGILTGAELSAVMARVLKHDCGAFPSEYEVTYEDMAKALVDAVGFGKDAAARAQYPWGYLLEAALNGITTGITASVGEPLTRGEAFQMVYNTLYVPKKDNGVLADLIIGKTYFVSPDGSDDNEGTAEKPWKSVHKAAQTLRAGETAVFATGVYQEEAPARFANSGSAEKPITLRSMKANAAQLAFSLTDAAVTIPKESAYVRIKGFSIVSDTEIHIEGSHAQMIDNTLSGNGEAVISGEGADNTVILKNIILSLNDKAAVGIQLANTSNFKVYNNIFAGLRTGIAFLSENVGAVSQNNIFYDCASDSYTFAKKPNGFVSDYNIYYNSYPQKLEPHSKFKDPGFAEPYSDWRLRIGSPAIGAGVPDAPEFISDYALNMGIYQTVSDLKMAEAAGGGIGGKKGDTLFLDNFSKANAAWAIVTGAWSFEDGKCKQTDAEAGRSVIRYNAGGDWANYDLCAKVTAPPTTVGSTVGLVFRADSEMKNMYVFRIYENNQLEFAKWAEGTFSSIEKWSYTTKPEQTYSLKVRIKGNKFTFYVDDSVVKEIEDDSYKKGTIGLYAFKQIAAFDDLSVNGN